MSEKNVLLETQGGIAKVILNRPNSLNAMNKQLVEELIEILLQLKVDNNIRVIILTGSGRGFCAGGDLLYLQSLNTIVAAREFIKKVGCLVEIIMNLEKPVIAMVNGIAAGAGFNLALACDIIYCSGSARFAQSFAKVGLVPDCGGMYLLPRIVGLHKAKELMFTADIIDADRAYQMGLVNQVVADDVLINTTVQLAQRLESSAPIALGLMKKVINKSDNLDLPSVLEFEANMQSYCMQTSDHAEGVNAFKEKRKPEFKGQ